MTVQQQPKRKRMAFQVVLWVDVAGVGAEYGYEMPPAEVREHIRSDLEQTLQVGVPYHEALSEVVVK